MSSLNGCRKRLCGILIWLICCTMYLALGMVIFVALEAENTEGIIAEKQALRDSVRLEVQTQFIKLNFTQEEVNEFMEKIKEAFSPLPYRWTYFNALSLSIQTITTIGYGYIVPLTTSGRTFCIFYALFGIPLAALLLQATGGAIYALIRCAIVHVCNKIKKDSEEQADFKSLVISMILLFMVILIFAAVYDYRGDQYIEGVYGWFITLTTIGFGDVIPGHDSTSAASEWLRIFFHFIGLSFTASVLSSLGSWIGSTNTRMCNLCSGLFHSKPGSKSKKKTNGKRHQVGGNEENGDEMTERSRQDTTNSTSL